MQVVMLDGTQVTLTGSGDPLTEAMSILTADTPIDLHNADYLLLPDGTKRTGKDLMEIGMEMLLKTTERSVALELIKE